MNNQQQKVADFMRLYQLQHDPTTHALDLTSEVGEVTKEILLATDYGHEALQVRPELVNELGDTLYSLLALAEACDIDIDETLTRALEKYESRLGQQSEVKSRINKAPLSKTDTSQTTSEDYENSKLETLEKTLGHHFEDRDVLIRALTHPSYLNEHLEEEIKHNQRLEFLGDAVLDFIAGAWVYQKYTDFDEGRMTRLRAALVRTEALAELARRVGIGEALRLGYGEMEAGGREREANLCDAFEAVVGALYLDGGMEAVHSFVEPLISPLAEATLATEADHDAKSRLQEWSQAELSITPHYRIAAEKGPDHAKTFIAEVLLEDKVIGRGSGHSKQAAEQAAAQSAWESIIWPDLAASEAASPDTDLDV